MFLRHGFGVDIYKDGTHKIKTDKGEMFIIQSPTINLNNYIDKKVIIEGAMQKLIDNKSEVFTVSKIKLADGSLDGGLTEYKNQKLGFKLKYPNSWELTEETEKLTFKNNGNIWSTLDVLSNTKSDLDSFVKSKEEKTGTAITISSQRSLRFTDSDTIRLYIPNKSQNRIYKITFNDKGEDAEKNKKLFYSFLESFTLITIEVSKGDICGGKASISCSEGYVCELSSNEENAYGVCVSVDKKASGLDCPYVSTPLDCKNYKTKNVNKNGCPTSYTCLDSIDDKTTDSANKLSQNSVDMVFVKYQKKILPSGAALLQIELIKKQSLLVAIYKLDDLKYKTLYQYSPSANEYNFVKEAHYKQVGTTWSLQDGKEVKITSEKKIIDPTKKSTSNNASAVVVKKDMVLYTNNYKNFSVQYPKDWYFKSFGAVGNAIWHVGFADKSVDKLSDIIIELSIIKGAGVDKKQSKSGTYSITKKRDKDSHFLLKGPLLKKDVIDKISSTITSN